MSFPKSNGLFVPTRSASPITLLPEQLAHRFAPSSLLALATVVVPMSRPPLPSGASAPSASAVLVRELRARFAKSSGASGDVRRQCGRVHHGGVDARGRAVLALRTTSADSFVVNVSPAASSVSGSPPPGIYRFPLRRGHSGGAPRGCLIRQAAR